MFCVAAAWGGAGKEPARPGIDLTAVRVDGLARVRIVHSDWPRHVWECRVPEQMRILGRGSEVLYPQEYFDARIGTVTLSGLVERPRPARYRFVFRTSDEGVEIAATVWNTGDVAWDSSTSGLTCVVFSEAPNFFDEGGALTSIHVGGEFVTVAELVQRSGLAGEAADEMMHATNVLRPEDAGWNSAKPKREIADLGLVVRSSEDGAHHVAVAWEDAFSVSYNLHDPRLNCIHSNPRFGALEPGEFVTVHGRIYFFSGTIDELYERFERDCHAKGTTPAK